MKMELGTNFYLFNFSATEVVTKEYLEYLPLEVLEAGIKSVSTLTFKLVMDKTLHTQKNIILLSIVQSSLFLW